MDETVDDAQVKKEFGATREELMAALQDVVSKLSEDLKGPHTEDFLAVGKSLTYNE